MPDVPAKPDMGLIIRRRAGQLTLSGESRNKPEEKGALETHTQLRLLKAAANHADESVVPVCWITIPLWTNCLKGFLVVYVLFIWFILNSGCGELLSSFCDALVLIQHFIPSCYTILHPSTRPPCASMSVSLSSVRMLLCTELKSSFFLLSRHKPSASFFLSLSLQLYLFFKYILGVVVINRGGRQSTAECLLKLEILWNKIDM